MINANAENMKTTQLKRLADAEYQLRLHTNSRRRKIVLTVALAALLIVVISLLVQHVR